MSANVYGGFGKAAEQSSAQAAKAGIDYGPLVAEVRKSFNTGKTRDVAWRKQQLRQLCLMIRENHERITAAAQADLGGSRMRGLAEFSGAFNEAEYALENIDKWVSPQKVKHEEISPICFIGSSEIRHEPKGVMLIIAPWNYPIQLLLGPMVYAIAAGNCIVAKPSEITVNCAKLIEELVHKYLDTSCIRVQNGAVAETTALLNEKWDHIMYTGNGLVGRIVAKAAALHLTPITLELGGKSPVYIDRTANIALAAERVSAGKWLNAGQTCIAPDYILVHESVKAEFTKKLLEFIPKNFGTDIKTDKDYGRISAPRHVERVAALLQKTEGKVLCGGIGTADPPKCFMEPTIVDEPSFDDRIMKEEIFGPVLPIKGVKNEDEAIAIINRIDETPLALYIFAENNALVQKIVGKTRSGDVCINSTVEYQPSKQLPFGGIGESGYGTWKGYFGFQEFSYKRSVFYKDTKILKLAMPVSDKATGDIYDFAVKLMVFGFLTPTQRAALKAALAALVVGIVGYKLRSAL